MKIRFIVVVLLIVALVAFAVILSSCDTEAENNVQIETQYGYTVSHTENYFLYETFMENQYLNFLEDFNYEEYEIVNISITTARGSTSSATYYYVTYKTIESAE